MVKIKSLSKEWMMKAYPMNEDINQRESSLTGQLHVNGDKSLVHIYKRLTSTMNLARQKALLNCPNHTIVIAEHQTDGRGRMNRRWQSDQGGLYMSWILRPTLDIPFCFAYTFSAALSIVETIRQNYSIAAHVKWPNDVLIGDCKIAGILTETQIENNELKFLNIGIGLNINNVSKSTTFKSISLHELLQQDVNKILFINNLLNKLHYRFEKVNPEEVLNTWKKYNCTIGKKVQVITPKSTICGLAVDVNPNGNLLVQKNNKDVEIVLYGDCFQDRY